MLERDFQALLIKEIKAMLPGALVLKNDPDYIQGIPDLLILYKEKWGALEVKKNSAARHQPNQDYYVKHMDELSFARFICPENKKEVLDELYRSLKS